jgi:hypothetical protein
MRLIGHDEISSKNVRKTEVLLLKTIIGPTHKWTFVMKAKLQIQSARLITKFD